MMKFHLGFENTVMYEEGFCIPTINAVLLFSVAGVTITGLVKLLDLHKILAQQRKGKLTYNLLLINSIAIYFG